MCTELLSAFPCLKESDLCSSANAGDKTCSRLYSNRPKISLRTNLFLAFILYFSVFIVKMQDRTWGCIDLLECHENYICLLFRNACTMPWVVLLAQV